MKIIPKKIKIKNTIWKNYSLLELIIALFIFIIIFLLFTSGIKFLSIFIGIIFLICYIPMGDDLFYSFIFELILYLVNPQKFIKNPENKKNDINKLLFVKDIDDSGIIEYKNNSYSRVFKIGQKNFLMEDEEHQEMDIESLSKALNSIELGTIIDIIKIDTPLDFEKYIIDLEQKINNEKDEIKKELLIERSEEFKKLNSTSKEYYSNFFIMVYSTSKDDIDLIADSLASEISKCGISTEFLSFKETAIFLKYNYTRNFDEKELDLFEMNKEQIIDWINPKEIIFQNNKYTIDNQELSTIAISDYPLKVKNGWGGELFNIPNTKVVMRINPIEKSKAIKRIDKCILELETQELLSSSVSEKNQTTLHSETMVDLLKKIQSENESLLDVSIFISCYNYGDNGYRRTIKNKIKNLNFKTNLLTYHQQNAFISSFVSPINKVIKFNRGINSVSLASFFPFIKNYIMDNEGLLLGKIKNNNHPFIFDIWKRGELYQNSNAFVIGKSGSGKTYFLKNLLINEWSNNTRIMICDPEAEYTSITRSLKGNIIDVGNAKEGILNPFQIYQILTEEGTNATPLVTFNTHLKTLESFFKIVLPGVANDVIEIINSLVIETYKYKGITEETNCIDYKPNMFPIFSDLYNVLESKIKEEKDKFILEKYGLAKIHLKKFVSGRYSDIWNNYSTLEVSADIISFNFQSLFANKNNIVANAQMLLIFRFIEQEIINAREKNRNGDNIKTIIVVDEAHLFIDPSYPIALDFFYQMNKRIRKYKGSFIPSTQNISDWNSNEELRHKTSTILKNSQYSFIFKLSSPDMQDVIDIYKAGESFNKEERKAIISATTGQAFFIGSSELRDTIKINANDKTKQLFD